MSASTPSATIGTRLDAFLEAGGGAVLVAGIILAAMFAAICYLADRTPTRPGCCQLCDAPVDSELPELAGRWPLVILCTSCASVAATIVAPARKQATR